MANDPLVAAPGGGGNNLAQDRPFRWSLLVWVAILALAFLGIWFAKRPFATTTIPAEMAAEIPLAKFADVTAEAGINFIHNNGAYGDKLLPETMGGGVA